MLAAGLDGIKKGLKAPDPVEENVYQMSDEERARRGIGMLPGTLKEAIGLTEQSDLVKDALGDHVFGKFIANKKIEWDQYRTHVTDFEVNRYLPIL